MADIKLALYKRVVWWDIGAWFIRWWTSSPYSHCELVIDGWSYSCSIQDGGVRGKQIEFNTDHWDYVALNHVDRNTVLQYFNRTCGQSYGWWSLIKHQLFNIRGEQDGQFCSEWCMNALGVPDGGLYSPMGASLLWKWINSIA